MKYLLSEPAFVLIFICIGVGIFLACKDRLFDLITLVIKKHYDAKLEAAKNQAKAEPDTIIYTEQKTIVQEPPRPKVIGKTLSMTCANCGALLDLNLDSLSLECPYCQNRLLIDTEVLRDVLVERERTRQEEINQLTKRERDRLEVESNERLERKNARIRARTERKLAKEQHKAEIQKQREEAKAQALREAMLEKERNMKTVRVLWTIFGVIVGIPLAAIVLLLLLSSGFFSLLGSFFSSF